MMVSVFALVALALFPFHSADVLVPYVSESNRSVFSMELASLAGLAVGMVHVGSAHAVFAAAILERLMEASEVEADAAIARHLALGLGLLFLGRTNAADGILEVVATIEHSIGPVALILVKVRILCRAVPVQVVEHGAASFTSGLSNEHRHRRLSLPAGVRICWDRQRAGRAGAAPPLRAAP